MLNETAKATVIQWSVKRKQSDEEPLREVKAKDETKQTMESGLRSSNGLSESGLG